jgi:hypothetical protein
MKNLSNMPELAALWSTAQYIPRGATTIHFTFSPGGAGALRNHFGQTRRREGTISCDDDYSFGPINPADPAARGEWVKTHLPWLREMYDVWPLPSTAEFWAIASSTKLRRVVWVSRRSIEEYTGFLEWVWRFGGGSYEVIDFTEVEASWRDENGVPKHRKLETLGALNPDYVSVDALLDQAAPLTDVNISSYREMWRKLRTDDAPLRVLQGQAIVSTSVTHYDELLLSFATTRWRRDITLIGDMITKRDVDVGREVTSNFLEARIWTLVDKGRLEGRRGPERWQGSVRLSSAAQ